MADESRIRNRFDDARVPAATNAGQARRGREPIKIVIDPKVRMICPAGVGRSDRLSRRSAGLNISPKANWPSILNKE